MCWNNNSERSLPRFFSGWIFSLGTFSPLDMRRLPFLKLVPFHEANAFIFVGCKLIEINQPVWKDEIVWLLISEKGPVKLKHVLVGGFKYVLFWPLRKWSNLTNYFSNGLVQPPTSILPDNTCSSSSTDPIRIKKTQFFTWDHEIFSRLETWSSFPIKYS